MNGVLFADQGGVDWLQGYITAKGKGIFKKTGRPMDEENAIDAAKVDAHKELLAVISGVQIDSKTVVKDMMVEKDETKERIRGVIRNSFQVGETKIKDAGDYIEAQVEMRVCLVDNAAGCKATQSVASSLPIGGKYSKKSSSCNLFGNLINTQEVFNKHKFRTNEPISLVMLNLNGKPQNTNEQDIGIGFLLENGQKCYIYSPKDVDPVVRRDMGMAKKYIRVSDAVQEFGSNMIVIEVMEIDEKNFITIKESDAYLVKLLRDDSKNKDMFRKAKVGIALNN
jgi:hypothetical protein